jgi:hypothetical protein
MFKCNVCGKVILYGRKHKKDIQNHSVTYDNKNIWCSGSFEDNSKEIQGESVEVLGVDMFYS